MFQHFGQGQGTGLFHLDGGHFVLQGLGFFVGGQEMAVDFVAQPVGLPHVEHFSLGVVEVVDAGGVSVLLDLLGEAVVAPHAQGLVNGQSFDAFFPVFGQQDAQELHGGTGVAVGAVAAGVADIQSGTQGVQPVRLQTRNEPTGQGDGVQGFALVVVAQSTEFVLDHAVVEGCVVRHKDGAFGHLHQPFGNFGELRCAGHHFGGDAGELLHKGLDGPFGVHQGDELVHNFVAVEQKDGNFGNAFFACFSAGGFYINNSVQGAHSRDPNKALPTRTRVLPF